MTNSMPMIDRVAAAIIESDLGGDAGLFSGCTLEAQNRYREIARAAIAAMREPTDAMYDAVHKDGMIDQDPSFYWPIMIDEALK